MTAKPPERMEKSIMQDVFSALSFFRPTTTQARPAVELVQLTDDSLPVVEEIEGENDCPACD
ncbi:MAG: hypothetical protein NUW24_00120 [Anaerolineae bacterium]|jgi:hypothetical protein|nr:hypothetical protein [Anaerolineae bacterium]MDH7472743.1 hypothetical protein [Anaerolineae bacterium]